jgi:hypothetical protein
MSGGETSGNMLDSNISKGHGHQSSPSSLRSAGAREVRVTTRHACMTEYETRSEEKELTHARGTSVPSIQRGERGEHKVANRLNGCMATR